MKFESLEDALEFAKVKEQKASDIYTMFQKIVKNQAAQKLLEELAIQERRHKQMIQDVLQSGNVAGIGGKKNISAVSFSDYIVAEDLTPDSDPQAVMTYAMKMEQSAYDLYKDLHANYMDTELEGLFARLAQEELKHKEILEEQYEEHFMQWM
jgi:rubrerythrin